MNNSLNVAVILVNYNGIKDSIECIKSIEKAQMRDEITVIFVDNASRVDETIQIRNLFPNVITIRSESNGGFAAGNNIGIKWALEHDYGYIMLLNNDTVIDKDMIHILKKHCDKQTVTAPKMLYYSKPDTIWYGGGTINKKTGNAEHWDMDCKESEAKHSNTEPQECTFATGCCMMFKTETIKKVGLLDDSYFMYCEDTDYCLRLLKAGIRILYIPKAKLWHKISASTGGDEKTFNIYYMTRNRIEVIQKHKDYFFFSALPFTVLSRRVRMIQMKRRGNPAWKAFQKGIEDGMNGGCGKADLSKI